MKKIKLNKENVAELAKITLLLTNVAGASR